jgi:hypothetical protein
MKHPSVDTSTGFGVHLPVNFPLHKLYDELMMYVEILSVGTAVLNLALIGWFDLNRFFFQESGNLINHKLWLLWQR